MKTKTDDLPTTHEARLAFVPALDRREERIRRALMRLKSDPPRVLLLEAGLVEERFSMALWYTALLNCQSEDAPCLNCPTCLQIGGRLFADIHILDGREGIIKVDSVRALRSLTYEAPRGGGVRVVILAEAQFLSDGAANALLKTLEEPNPRTVFVLLTPQRARLLPTLVSRSWVLTLAWPDIFAPQPENMRPWISALDTFLRSGQGWMELTSAKGAVDNPTARQVVLSLQKSLSSANTSRADNNLDIALEQLDVGKRFILRNILAKAEESLNLPTPVNPALVLNWLASRLFVLCQGG